MTEPEFEIYEDLMPKIKKLEPEAHCTYFHGEPEMPNGFYQVHKWGVPISEYNTNIIAALEEALEKLKQ